MSEASEKTSITTVTEATDFIGEIARTAANCGAEKIRFVHRATEVEAQFFRPGEDRIALVKHMTPEGFRVFNLALSDRLYLWPDATDGLYATNPRRKRLMLCSRGATPFLADVVFEQTKERKTANLLLEKITTSNVIPLTDRWVLSEKNDAFLESLLQCPSGLILCAQGSKPGQPDATAMISAMRPEVAIYNLPREAAVIKQVLKDAEQRLVIATLTSDDGIELMYEFQGQLSGNRALEEQFSDVLVFTHVHRRVRRVCGNCSRQSPITQQATEKIPLYLAPDEGQTYMFGRGCQLCGHAAYRGSIGLDSMLYVTEDIRELLRRRAPLADIVRAAYGLGMRTLMEDGLAKIYQGYTSFEEITQAAKRPSDVFASVITNHRHQAHRPAKAEPEVHAPIDDTAPLEVDVFSSNRRAAVTPDSPSKGRLLVIEDDADQRAVLELVFKSDGYTVVMAEGGREGIELLEDSPVDVVVCDLMMPDMSGDDVVRFIRKHPTLKETPFLMLTANDNADQEFVSLEHGADDYCSKTVKRKILLKRVEKLLERRVGKNPLGHLLG